MAMTDKQRRKAHTEAVKKNQKKSYYRHTISLNKNTDADIIALIENSDNKAQLIKTALRSYAEHTRS